MVIVQKKDIYKASSEEQLGLNALSNILLISKSPMTR